MRERIGPVAAFKLAITVGRLPKTRSGKILRGTMKKIADGDSWSMPATIDDPAILGEIGEALKGASGTVSVGVSAPAALAGAGIIATAAGFQARMQGVRALLRDASEEEFSQLGRAAQQQRRAPARLEHNAQRLALDLHVQRILHLLGHDHAEDDERTTMFALQRQLLSGFLGRQAPAETIR